MAKSSMYDAGRREHTVWKLGMGIMVKTLGPYRRGIALSEIHDKLGHRNLSAQQKSQYERGWQSVPSS